MHNYNINTNISQKIWRNSSFFVMYKLENDAWLNTPLPEPSLLAKLPNGYNIIGFAIMGFMGTEKSRRYARDVIFKVKEILKLNGEGDVKIYPFFPSQGLLLNKNTIIHNYVYELDELNVPVPRKFKSYRSVTITELGKFAQTARETEDILFDAIRFQIYDFVKANGKNALTIDYVNLIALDKYKMLKSKKGESTARAKAKAIYKWVIANYNPGSGRGKWNWNYKRKTKDDKELEMLRSQNAKKQAEKKYEEMHKKIISLVTGMFKDEYKRKNGKYNIKKISQDLKISRTTVYKHLKNENLI